MTKVWIARCLCPRRHIILAGAAAAESEAEAGALAMDPLREALDQMIESGRINPWCGICYAPHIEWHYELAATIFANLDEARPALQDFETQQIAAGILYGEFFGAAKNRGNA